MTLIFLSHLEWGSLTTSGNFPGCNDRSDVSMVAEPNGKCGDSYPYNSYPYSETAPVKWKWFLCKNTNTCIHEKARLECLHLNNLDFTLSKD